MKKTFRNSTSLSLASRARATFAFCIPHSAFCILHSAFCIAFAAGLVRGDTAVMHVAPTSEAPAYPYDTWRNAATNVQDAVDAACDGVTIVVSNGAYAISAPITIAKGVTLRGLTGNPEDVVFANDNAERLLYLNHADAVAAGFVLEGGSRKVWGQGAYIYNAGGTVSNCVVRGCTASGSGGYASAVYVGSAYGLVTHCAVTNNAYAATGTPSSYFVPGIAVYQGGRVENTLVADNADTGARNSGQWAASGVRVDRGRLLNCTVVNNSGPAVGGVWLNHNDAANCSAINCVVAGNASTTLAATYGNTLPNANSKKRFDHCATDDDEPINASCTNAPVSVLFAGWDRHDYRPAANSPLVDAGVSSGLAVGTADLDGRARVMGDAVDIGCFELDPDAFTASFSTEATTLTLPCTVTFTAACTGAGGSDVIRYSWDFDGDGETDLVTTDATVSRTYTEVGTVTVSMSAVNETTGARGGCVREDYLHLFPRTMHVAPGSGAPAFPYDTWRNAATNVQDAVDAACDGVTIVVSNGAYAISAPITIAKGVTLRGLTGNPEDVVFANDNAERLLYLNHADAVAAGFVLEGGSRKVWGQGAYIYNAGGTVSNCVVRGCTASGSGGYASAVYVGSAYGLVTHCAVTNNAYAATGTPSSYFVPGIAVYQGGRVENTLVADNADTGARNSGQWAASGVRVDRGRLLNCTVVNNSGPAVGGVWLNHNDAANCSAINCVVAGNASTTLAATYGNTLPNANSKKRFDHCATDDDEPINASCTNAPVSVLFAGWDRHDYRPAANSPLVDAGVSSGLAVGTADLAGRPRIFGKAIDIGCYESLHHARTVLILQ